MVKLTNNFGKNLWFTFTQLLNEKIYKFLIFKVIKSWVASKYTAPQTKAVKKNDTIKKELYIFYGQKDHLPWNTGHEQ